MSLAQGLAFVLPAEGGFVDNVADSGGATNRGITQRVYDNFRDTAKLPRQSVELISDSEVDNIYSNEYWTPAKCSSLTDKMGVCHFDTAVNLGVNAAIKLLQRTCGLDEDGIFGPATLQEVTHGGDSLVIPYLDERRAYYRSIVAAKPSQEIFARGWANRCNALEDYVSNLK